uniref:Uncharacterized protein n=1 Tax=Lutzomyia longipalpis TaxID=7200 RepID=A0A1B0CUQ4_LUTLO
MAKPQLDVGEWNEAGKYLVPKENIIFPPLHIKLGLMKQLSKQMSSDCLDYIRLVIPELSIQKIDAGDYCDEDFEKEMSKKELEAWTTFKDVSANFLGNRKSPDYKNIVQKMLKAFHCLGARMSIKMHILDKHLDTFPQNLGAMSDEQGERFHQDMAPYEKRYNGKSIINMLADYYIHTLALHIVENIIPFWARSIHRILNISNNALHAVAYPPWHKMFHRETVSMETPKKWLELWPETQEVIQRAILHESTQISQNGGMCEKWCNHVVQLYADYVGICRNLALLVNNPTCQEQMPQTLLQLLDSVTRRWLFWHNELQIVNTIAPGNIDSTLIAHKLIPNNFHLQLPGATQSRNQGVGRLTRDILCEEILGAATQERRNEQMPQTLLQLLDSVTRRWLFWHNELQIVNTIAPGNIDSTLIAHKLIPNNFHLQLPGATQSRNQGVGRLTRDILCEEILGAATQEQRNVVAGKLQHKEVAIDEELVTKVQRIVDALNEYAEELDPRQKSS